MAHWRETIRMYNCSDSSMKEPEDIGSVFRCHLCRGHNGAVIEAGLHDSCEKQTPCLFCELSPNVFAAPNVLANFCNCVVDMFLPGEVFINSDT